MCWWHGNSPQAVTEHSKELEINASRLATTWLRGTVVERQSLAGELSLSHTRLAADGC